MSVQMSKEVRDRVFAAADELYEQSDRESFPTVDVVRRAAKVNMNDASAAMKEWRRAQTSQASPLAVQVPDAVMQAAQAFVGSLWSQAQELANESLRAAQAGWEAEREELDVMRQELAEAYEAQASELEVTAGRLAELEKTEAAARAEVVELRARLSEASEHVATSEARAGELRTELDHAHQDAQRLRTERENALDAVKAARSEHKAEVKELRAELEGVRSSGAKERDRLTANLSEVKAQLLAERSQSAEQRKQSERNAVRIAGRLEKAEAERDTAREGEGAAREEAATLRGRLEALTEVVSGSKDA